MTPLDLKLLVVYRVECALRDMYLAKCIEILTNYWESHGVIFSSFVFRFDDHEIRSCLATLMVARVLDKIYDDHNMISLVTKDHVEDAITSFINMEWS